MKKPTRAQVYRAFKPYYTALLNMLNELESSAVRRYKSTQIDHRTYDDKGREQINKRYRAIYAVRDPSAPHYRHELEEIARLYYRALEKINPKYDPTNKPDLPIYVPRIHDDPRLQKIQLHINRAHSSVNYKKDEVMPVASCGSLSISEAKADPYTSAMYDALVELGYKPTYKVKKRKLMLCADVASVCDDYGCDSLQLRSHTGSQIRASFFSVDESGLLEKSKMQSVGVLLVARDVEVYKSYPRSRRADAIYTEEHPREIVLDCIPERDRIGRIYKV